MFTLWSIRRCEDTIANPCINNREKMNQFSGMGEFPELPSASRNPQSDFQHSKTLLIALVSATNFENICELLGWSEWTSDIIPGISSLINYKPIF